MKILLPKDFPQKHLNWIKSVYKGADIKSIKVLDFNEFGAYVKVFHRGYSNRAGEVFAGITQHIVVRYDVEVKYPEIENNYDFTKNGRLNKVDKEYIDSMFSLTCHSGSKLSLVSIEEVQGYVDPDIQKAVENNFFDWL